MATKKKTNTRTRGAAKKRAEERKKAETFRLEVKLWIVVAISLILFVSNFGVGGIVGSAISSFLFGIFGLVAYIFPFILLIGTFFAVSNRGNTLAVMKIVAGILFLFFLCMLLTMVSNDKTLLLPLEAFDKSRLNKTGGGVIGGLLAYVLTSAFGSIGAYIVDIIVIIVSLVLLTEKSAMRGMKRGGQKVYASAKENHETRMRKRDIRRTDKKVRGVADTTIIDKKSEKNSDEMNELYPPFEPEFAEPLTKTVSSVVEVSPVKEAVSEAQIPEPKMYLPKENMEAETVSTEKPKQPKRTPEEKQQEIDFISQEIAKEETPQKPYEFPPKSLLKQNKNKGSGNSQEHLKETAIRLQQTLKTFGVNVTVTDISCGPSVTRYEIQPEMGVKVSKIVNLADDIKLNLAVADIRIEAPIPGKAAVGIEVPNKENMMVSFRELIESKEFVESKSKISFAVGRDIGGNVMIADIAKMPHVLIAGATGSGKSVCINTIIMSILYKADPSEVKLIMIDPKVVELSVYNGIPHLMIPVVTDPKKAAGALNWAVAEMTERYNKFAECGVRKYEEYNAKIDKIKVPQGQEQPKKMPLIVIIVDELADLMMVASHEVEDSICRLAQLARAAGIHLVIATQRPSVNVITGLIKANMPSRIAFAVTSGIDSRTILDMNGAEKLLGKGDMLFNPQGVPKPIRVQGAFVSDEEVSEVVSFISEHNGGSQYNAEVQQKMETLENSEGKTVTISEADPGDGKDSYFEEAARIIVDKEKASIGMLQRYLKIGFNRAARIMDQLEEAGVVGPEEGTKPRKVLMTTEEFQQFIDGNPEK